MGIALPPWIVEAHNNVWVLGTYGILFGIGLPVIVVCNLSSSQEFEIRLRHFARIRVIGGLGPAGRPRMAFLLRPR
jgi:preprotein translocase subunit Sec63